MTLKESTQDAAPRPFVVGGAGNRRLPGDTSGLESGIDLAFWRIATEAGFQLSDLVLEVSLAEGADRLLVQSARRLAIPYRCVLPCSPACFAEDFGSPSSIATFELLLAGAQSVTIPDFVSDSKSYGYLWASQRVLDRADLLLAVWDGEPGRGPGGTAHTVQTAMDRGIPVLWLPTKPPFAPVRLESLVHETS